MIRCSSVWRVFVFTVGMLPLVGMGCSDSVEGGGGGEGAGLCEGVACNDDISCTVDACDPSDGVCDYTPAADGTECLVLLEPGGQVIGFCISGSCTVGGCNDFGCEDAVCRFDGVCNPSDGRCDYTFVANGTPCGSRGASCRDGFCSVESDF